MASLSLQLSKVHLIATPGVAAVGTVLADAGFTRVRVAAQTPVNTVLEARQ